MEATVPVGSSNIGLQIAILLVSVVCVAFFSSSEAALISVSKIRLRSLADKGNRGAQAALRVVANHDRLFATILLTENAFIILASSVGTALALRLFGEGGQYLATLIMTIVLVTFGEITPKTFAAANAERMALIEGRMIEIAIKVMTAPVWLLTRVTNALVRLLSGPRDHQPPIVTTDELRMLID
ncbi:MAG: CNNM domain-containing protein, partial [Anaerolineae bacterium]